MTATSSQTRCGYSDECSSNTGSHKDRLRLTHQRVIFRALTTSSIRIRALHSWYSPYVRRHGQGELRLRHNGPSTWSDTHVRDVFFGEDLRCVRVAEWPSGVLLPEGTDAGGDLPEDLLQSDFVSWEPLHVVEGLNVHKTVRRQGRERIKGIVTCVREV